MANLIFSRSVESPTKAAFELGGESRTVSTEYQVPWRSAFLSAFGWTNERGARSAVQPARAATARRVDGARRRIGSMALPRGYRRRGSTAPPFGDLLEGGGGAEHDGREGVVIDGDERL